MKKIQFFFFAIIAFQIPSMAQLRLPSLLSSNMVLQQNDSVTLWGWAAPSQMVYVTNSWDNQKDSAQTNNEAQWKLKIKTPAAGGPYTVSITADETIKLDNVMIGEVWVCSGQSNMEWGYHNGVADLQPEINANVQSNIRFFYVPKTGAEYPQDDTKSKWEVCDSNTIKQFSAVGYFFGKKISNDLHVPIGLINSNWGGTPAETWTPADKVNDDPTLLEAAKKKEEVLWWPVKPGALYNGMIYPLMNYNIAGAIWYQGESNVSTASSYNKLFTTMIQSWRAGWKKNLPFYFVQIAPFNYGEGQHAELLREQQAMTTTLENTGMVVVSDITGDVKNIHPTDKKDVGARLANWALAETYHQKIDGYKTPTYKSAEWKDKMAIIHFDNAASGLMMTGKKTIGVQVAGADKKFYDVNAKIDFDKLIVPAVNGVKPVAVRFSFDNTTVGNLFSKGGLPVAPFRTDDW